MNLNEADILMLCPKCGMLLAEELVSPEGMGRECTNCGETNRLIEINVADQVSAIDRIKGAFREHGIEQWTKMFVYGQEYYGETNEVRTVVRVMDWKNRHEPESYYELITKAGRHGRGGKVRSQNLRATPRPWFRKTQNP
jgi:hypothetical protein